MIAGIILAAGASQRMGTPKALLDLHGETFVGRLVRVMSLACDSVTVVLGNHVDAIRPHVPQGAKIAVNPDPDRGQLSSLQTALMELPEDATGFAFIPVDSPAVAEATVEALSAAFMNRSQGTELVIPRRIAVDGSARRGHPVFASRRIADELRRLLPTAEAREVIHRYVPQTQYLDVQDEGIFADIDTPKLYRQWLQKTAPGGPR